MPSDGQPIRLPIGELNLNRTERIVAAPEASLNAARVFELNNKNGQALLPGKVTLYFGANFLGATAIDFVGPGEEFSLYAGVEDEVKVSRVLDRSKSEKRKTSFSSKTELQASWIIEVEKPFRRREERSLGGPYSRFAKRRRKGEIRKDHHRKVTPDEKGLFSWDLSASSQGKTNAQRGVRCPVSKGLHPKKLPKRLGRSASATKRQRFQNELPAVAIEKLGIEVLKRTVSAQRIGLVATRPNISAGSHYFRKCGRSNRLLGVIANTL